MISIVIDFIKAFIAAIIAIFIVYSVDEHTSKKKWKREKDLYTVLLSECKREIIELNGGETELTERIRNIL